MTFHQTHWEGQLDTPGDVLDDSRGPILSIKMTYTDLKTLYYRVAGDYNSFAANNYLVLNSLQVWQRNRIVRLYLNLKRATALLLQTPFPAVHADEYGTLHLYATDSAYGDPCASFVDESTLTDVYFYPLVGERVRGDGRYY